MGFSFQIKGKLLDLELRNSNLEFVQSEFYEL